MVRSLPRKLVMAGVLAVCSPLDAFGSINTLQQSVHVDAPAGIATFTLFFDHAPDLQNIDSGGHVVDSFQMQVNGDWSPGANTFGPITAVIRGDEIHFNGELPIRSAAPVDLSTRSGGWGPVIDTVPISLSGNALSFSAPLKDLGNSNGVFAYSAFVMEHGQITAQAQAQSVPLPTAMMMSLPLLGAVLARVRFGKGR